MIEFIANETPIEFFIKIIEKFKTRPFLPKEIQFCLNKKYSKVSIFYTISAKQIWMIAKIKGITIAFKGFNTLVF